MLKTLKQMKNFIKTGSRMKEATILRLKKNTIIHDAFDVLMDSFEDTGKFDFSAVDSLSDELKSSDSYKQEAADVVNLCCEALVKLHQKVLYFHSICYADNSQFTALRRYCP